MVRIIPNRLKSGFSNSTSTNSASNSRSTSPMGTKGDVASPEGRKDNGLVLSVAIIRVRASDFVSPLPVVEKAKKKRAN